MVRSETTRGSLTWESSCCGGKFRISTVTTLVFKASVWRVALVFIYKIFPTRNGISNFTIALFGTDTKKIFLKHVTGMKE